MNAWMKMTWITALSAGLATAGCGDDDDPIVDGMGGDAMGAGGSTGGSTPSGGSGGMDATGGMGMGAMGGGDSCQTIVEIASGDEQFSTLVAALTKANLVSAAQQDDITVFAPTNDAFADLLSTLGAASLDDLSAEQLAPILTYHVADSVVPSSAAIDVAGMGDNTFDTLGGTITLDVEGEDLVIDTDEAAATVATADIAACNGVVHVVDAVLLPSVADIVAGSANADYSELLGLVAAADSTDTIVTALDTTEDITLFAPTNAAIQGLAATPSGTDLDGILQYHVYAGGAVDSSTALGYSDQVIAMLNGDNLTVDGGSTVDLDDSTATDKQVTIVDIYASNGIIHRIDGVLLP